MSGRRLAWGAVPAALYVTLALAMVGAGRPVLPLFDGVGPAEPYRWVDPPDDAATPGQTPLPGRSSFPLEPNSAVTVISEDGQAQASALTENLVLPKDEREVVATLTPLDPETIGPPPQGQRFDSNAYEVEMVYEPSGDPVELTGEVTVLLRYARHGTMLRLWTGSAWEPLETTVLAGTLQVFANPTEIGTFVVTGPPQPPGGGGDEDRGTPWQIWVAYGAAGLAVIAAVELLIRRRRAEAEKKRTGKRGKSKKKR